MKRTVFLALATIALMATTAYVQASPKSSDETQVRQSVEQFERGLSERKLELIEPIVAPDVVVFENGHRNDGWADFRDHHLVPEMAEPSPPSQHEVIRVKAGADVAWAYTRTTAQMKRANGTTAELLIWSIYIFEKRAGEWRLVSLDWSISSKPTG